MNFAKRSTITMPRCPELGLFWVVLKTIGLTSFRLMASFCLSGLQKYVTSLPFKLRSEVAGHCLCSCLLQGITGPSGCRDETFQCGRVAGKHQGALRTAPLSGCCRVEATWREGPTVTHHGVTTRFLALPSVGLPGGVAT